MGQEPAARGQWGNPIEFMMTMVSFAVGLGNVWRFPYLAYKNGGGAFLIPYVIMLLLIGMPIYLLETSMGQYAGLGATRIWRASPLFKGVGFATVLSCWIIGTYYNVIVSYCAYYLFTSFTSNLPWSDCGNGNNTWATHACINTARENSTKLEKYCVNGTVVGPKSASEEFYYYSVAGMTNGIEQTGHLQWKLLLSFFGCWTLIALVLCKGAQSLGKVVYVTAIFPYIMLTILLINNCLQAGAVDGIIFYLKPDFNRLLDYEVWVDAASQIFYSLSCCYSGLVVMSSYNNFKHNILRDTVIVCFINCGTSIYAGFSIFSALGHIASVQGLNVSQVATKGPELAFVVYPQALATMPIAPLWSVLFYIMMVLLGFGSQFSNVEAVIASLMDQFPGVMRKSKARSLASRIAMCVLCFIIGMPMITQGGLYLLSLVDGTMGVPLLITGLLECIGISWVYGIRRWSNNIKEMIGYKPSIYWIATLAVIAPAILAMLVVLKLYSTFVTPLTYSGFIYDDNCPYQYPWWTYFIMWLIVLSPFICFILGAAHQIIKFSKIHGYSMKTLYEASKPSHNWKPQEQTVNKESAESEQQDKVYFTGSKLEWGKHGSIKEGVVAHHMDKNVQGSKYSQLNLLEYAAEPDSKAEEIETAAPVSPVFFDSNGAITFQNEAFDPKE